MTAVPLLQAAELETALEAHDVQGVRAAAHALKGAAETSFVRPLAEVRHAHARECPVAVAAPGRTLPRAARPGGLAMGGRCGRVGAKRFTSGLAFLRRRRLRWRCLRRA